MSNDRVLADQNLKACVSCKMLWETEYVGNDNVPVTYYYSWFNLNRGKERKTCPDCEKKNEKQTTN